MAGAATAIDNALLFESLRRHTRHVEAINAIAQLLGKLMEPAEHLDEILRAIVETLAYDAGVLSLRLAEGRLERAASCGGPIPASAAEGKPPFVVPLRSGTTELGELELYRCGTGTPHPTERATILAIAAQLAMALENAQLSRTAREVEVLRRADRLKSDFLASVSHDLRSPLTAICAGIDGMLESSGESASGFLLTIRNQADRLGRLVDQLLDLSQIESDGLRLHCEWYDLQSLLDDVLEEIEPLYGRSRVILDIPKLQPLLFVDRDRFIQVLYNLIVNACTYSPTYTTVTIDATWTEGAITFGLTDRGCGIRSSDRENIFKRFYRGERSAHATRSLGLGLAICRGIVEAHGGSIWLEEPSPAVGSVFRVCLPLRRDFGAVPCGLV